MRLHFSVGQFSFALSTVQNSAIKWAMRHVCLNSYFDILVNSMTIRSMLKLPKIA